MSSLYSFYFIFFPCPMSHFSVPHLIIPYFFQMSRAWRPGRTPGFPYSAQQDAPGNARRPGRLFWGFYLCFLVGGLLILLGEEVQLRIRGGCRACYREVRPLAVSDLINVYFHPINLLPLLIFHSAHSGLRLSRAKHSLIWSSRMKYD